MWRLLLERLPRFADHRATLIEWHQRLGSRCEVVFPRYLRETPESVDAVPCHRDPPCGYSHAIHPQSAGRLLAVCEDKDAECEPFQVQRKDLAVLRFDLSALVADIAETLSVRPSIVSVRSRPALFRLGEAPHNAEPVFLGIPGRCGDATRLCETVAIEAPNGAILLLPTDTGLDGDTRRTANARHVCLAVLHQILTFDQRRGWLAEQDLEDLFPSAANHASGLKRLHLPAGTMWRQIVVTAFADGGLSVSHHTGSPHQTYSRRELGMEKENRRPRRSWESLQQCLEIGCIPDAGTEVSAESARNRAREITAVLRRVTGLKGPAFGISDTPLNGSQARMPHHGFWPLFKLRWESDRIQPRRGNYRPPTQEPENPKDSD